MDFEDTIEGLIETIVKECVRIRAEMPNWWKQEQAIGNGAAEAVADSYIVDNTRTAALIPEIMQVLNARFNTEGATCPKTA